MTTRTEITIGLLALALIGGSACGGAASSGPSGATNAPPDPRAQPIPSTIQRDDAIAIVRRLDQQVGRIDRIDAKLLTLDEYVRVAGPIRAHPGDPSATPMTGTTGIIGDPAKRYLWAVAVSGEVWPNMRMPISFGHPLTTSPTPYPSYRWGIFLVEAVPARLFGVGDAGIAEAWPSVFDKLPNHPITTYVPPSPTPRLTAIATKIQQPEATTAVMRATAEVRRIDRIEAKLMTWREYVASGDPGAQKPSAIDDSAPVWIIAVSGEIVPQFGRGATFTWGVFTIDAMSGGIESLSARSDGVWPTFFDALPDYPAAAR
jgi:hypothetical protein